MNSRDAILRALRRSRLEPVELPPLDGPFVRYDDKVLQFEAALGRAAGSLIRANSSDAVVAAVSQLSAVRSAAAICSLVPEVSGNVPLKGRASTFDSVDVVVLRAELGVAENGALWITDEPVRQRSVYFLAQHVVALLDAACLVQHMHEAYAALEVSRTPFGCFVSGPSKTADIEQALVVGAHGPRSLSVVLHGDPEP